MTVKEVIENLQGLPEGAQVSVEDDDGNQSYIVEIEFTGKLVIVKVQEE